jgi:F-type H+-transporting ATPase subunit b
LTSGAVEEADKAIAAAAARASEYADRLRHARAEVFRLREQRQQQAAQDREKQVDAARRKAQQHVFEARLSLDAEATAARQTLLASADQLAEQVVRAVLSAAAGGSR